MSWCECGKSGPTKEHRGACYTCHVRKWYPDRMPPSTGLYPFKFPVVPPRYQKCPACGQDMSKRVPCVSCKDKKSKAEQMKVCPNCSKEAP